MRKKITINGIIFLFKERNHSINLKILHSELNLPLKEYSGHENSGIIPLPNARDERSV